MGGSIRGAFRITRIAKTATTAAEAYEEVLAAVGTAVADGAEAQDAAFEEVPEGVDKYDRCSREVP